MCVYADAGSKLQYENIGKSMSAYNDVQVTLRNV